MRSIVGLLLIVVILGGLGLVGFAYLGPLLGADFSSPKQEIRIPVTLDAN